MPNIAANVPQHLVIGAKTGFLAALPTIVQPYQEIASVVQMNAKTITFTDLGASPWPVESKGQNQVQDFTEKALAVTAKDWEITVGISHNAIQDDLTGTLNSKVRGAGEGFQGWINQEVFQALNDGDTINYGLAYDGLDFFSASHFDKGADYQTVQSNLSNLALSLDNFSTVKVASNKFKNDRGKAVRYNHNLLVVSPELEYTAGQICINTEAYDTANREKNPYAGNTRYLVAPEFDSTAWALVAANQSLKPILIGEREAPNLNAAWFDPKAAEGGIYYFKFYARYVFFYSDWRLAHLGKS